MKDHNNNNFNHLHNQTNITIHYTTSHLTIFNMTITSINYKFVSPLKHFKLYYRFWIIVNGYIHQKTNSKQKHKHGKFTKGWSVVLWYWSNILWINSFYSGSLKTRVQGPDSQNLLGKEKQHTWSPVELMIDTHTHTHIKLCYFKISHIDFFIRTWCINCSTGFSFAAFLSLISHNELITQFYSMYTFVNKLNSTIEEPPPLPHHDSVHTP